MADLQSDFSCVMYIMFGWLLASIFVGRNLKERFHALES